jgi:LmbE family N-acetylglucosaminyl deacetylase
MAVLAHPDDESLGVGGTLAKYASEGVDVFLLTATRGDSGRFRGYRLDDHQHPGPLALANIREAFRKLVSTVDGIERQAMSWPDWAITTVMDKQRNSIET